MVLLDYTGLMGTTIEKTCEFCNKIFPAQATEHKRGNSRFCTRSCAAKHNNKKRWSGKPRNPKRKYSYGERKSIWAATVSKNGIVGRIKQRCRKRNVPCEITSKVFQEMWDAQNGQCFYTSNQMTLGLGTIRSVDPDQASVDRKDPNGGYTKENMVLCCLWVNCAKGRMTLGELVERSKGLIAHSDG